MTKNSIILLLSFTFMAFSVNAVSVYLPDESWNNKLSEAVNFNATGIGVLDNYLYICGNNEKAFLKVNLNTDSITKMPDDFLVAPHGLRVYEGFLWVTDIENHQVFKLTPEGKVIQSFGEKGQPGTGNTRFDQPTDVAVSSYGNIYIADGYGNSRIICYDSDGNYLFEWGKPGNGPGEFKYPHSIIIHSGKVYVADRGNNRLQIFSMKGEYIAEWNQFGKVFWLYSNKDSIFITRTTPETHSVILTDIEGKILDEFGSKGEKYGQFNVPHSLVGDGDCLYVSEVINKRVQKFIRK
jgi:DNA-binding beta-propeller fold protein YncE